MAVERQVSDGSVQQIRESDSFELSRAGGIASNQTPTTALPAFVGGSTMEFLIAGGTDTAGGLLGWKNTFPFDIIIVAHQIDVTTVASGACTVSFGQTATNATTSASNLISGQDVHAATGTFNGGALSIKVKQNEFITGSKASGATAALVARALFTYLPVPAAGVG